MPFDMRPLFQALIALWTIVQGISTFNGNVLEIANANVSRPVIYGVFFLAGLSETYGTRAVTLFLNKVGRRPFFITLILTAATYVLGAIAWTMTIAVIIGAFYPIDAQAQMLVVAVVIGYIPLLFAFLAFIPYLGPAILLLLQGLSLIFTTAALSVGYGLPLWDAALCTIGGWLLFQLLRWFTSWPTTVISRWLLRLISGRDVTYKLSTTVQAMSLGLREQRGGSGDGGEQ